MPVLFLTSLFFPLFLFSPPFISLKSIAEEERKLWCFAIPFFFFSSNNLYADEQRQIVNLSFFLPPFFSPTFLV